MCVCAMGGERNQEGKRKEEKGKESRKYQILAVVCAFQHSPELRVKLGWFLRFFSSLHPTPGMCSLPLALQCWASSTQCWNRQHRGDKPVQPLCAGLTARAEMGKKWIFLLNFCSAQSYPLLCVYIWKHPLFGFFFEKHNQLKKPDCLKASHDTPALHFKKETAPHRLFAAFHTTG